MAWAVVFVIVALILVGALVVSRRRAPSRKADYDSGVESFRRQINALSPQARRGVIDRVRDARERDSVEE